MESAQLWSRNILQRTCARRVYGPGYGACGGLERKVATGCLIQQGRSPTHRSFVSNGLLVLSTCRAPTASTLDSHSRLVCRVDGHRAEGSRMPEESAATGARQRIEKSRTQFRSLIAANPNYFGNLEASPYAPVEQLASSTSYEELTTLGYNPASKRLFATIDINKSAGYGGDLCDDGTVEYVRFYVDFGGGWLDAGLAGTAVHDIPAGKDCSNKNTHPLTCSVEVDYSPPRKWCTSPQLPKARAILSWNLEPPSGDPDWQPVYGNVLECHIQIDKSWWLGDLFEVMKTTVDLPPSLLESIETLQPIPEPGPPDPAPLFTPAKLTVGELAERYVKLTGARKEQFAVEPSRFAFAEYQAIKKSSDSSPASFASLTASLGAYDIDIGELVAAIEDTTGNINYEELEDVGLDRNLEKVTATYRVKLPTGFSGSFCSDGSTEYVAFWADWDNTCQWTYLGTIEVRAYDFEALPDGGLCYTAALPVDLNEFRQECDEPKIAQVRAVLSWNAPPSTTDPNAVPYWGNRLDAHVLIPPGPGIEGVYPLLTVVGGIGVPYIGNLSGVTTATAKFVDNGLPADSLGRPCPFGGRIVVRGPGFPGHKYRVQVREVGTTGWSTLSTKIWVTDKYGFGSWHYPDIAGWFDYLSFDDNFAGILAYFNSAGDAKWQIRLEIQGVFGYASQRVQLDNTGPNVDVWITEPTGDCGLLTPGDLLKGRATATDPYLRSWSVVIDGGPSGFGPEPVTTMASTTTNTPVGGAEWEYDTTGLVQCGYVVRVNAWDRAIVDSVHNGHYRSDDVGFCVLEEE